MSIAVTIDNPINDEESKFYIPFSTQANYYRFWLKGSDNLDLELMPYLEGLDVDKETWKILKQEIRQMMIWADRNLDSEGRNEIHERSKFVINTLDLVFKRDDAIVNFG